MENIVNNTNPSTPLNKLGDVRPVSDSALAQTLAMVLDKSYAAESLLEFMSETTQASVAANIMAGLKEVSFGNPTALAMLEGALERRHRNLAKLQDPGSLNGATGPSLKVTYDLPGEEITGHAI